jgi:hypothetical protein
LVLAAALAMGLLPACSAGSASHVGESSSYKLYTHCGVREARIGNDYFVAMHPLDDGSGNPPQGWGNPYQQGRMKRISSTVAVFTDARGHRVEFRLRPSATAFQQVCS